MKYCDKCHSGMPLVGKGSFSEALETATHNARMAIIGTVRAQGYSLLAMRLEEEEEARRRNT